MDYNEAIKDKERKEAFEKEIIIFTNEKHGKQIYQKERDQYKK